MTASEKARDEVYDQLLAISRKTFREGSFEVAYHALTAAMHRAKDKKNVPYLRELLQEAGQQKQRIDTSYPDHPLSTSSAASRKHESVYQALERSISTQLRFYDMQDLVQDHSQQQEHTTRE